MISHRIAAGVVMTGFLLSAVLMTGQVVSLSPGSLNFGNQAVGTTSSSRSVRLTNTGTAPLVISSITPPSAPSPFSVSHNCPLSPAALAPNARCVISATFTPTATVTSSGSISIADNASNSPQTIPLSGTGVPQATLSTSSLNFGNQAIGTSSIRTVTLNNNLNTTLTFNGATAGGDFSVTTASTNPCGSTVAAGGHCSIGLIFTPTQLGSSTATLTVSDSASNSSQTAALSGNGVVQAYLLPTSLNFSNQGVGTSNTRTVTLYNNLNTALTFNGASAGGDFSVTTASTKPCGSSVPANGHCSIAVTFTPTQLGSRTATLTVSDSASNSPQTASLTGSGTASSLASISVSGASSTIPVGATDQFTAIGTFPGNIMLNVTTQATWSSTSAKVATVSTTSGSQGLATGVAAGTTTIRASLNQKSGSASLTVTTGGQITPTINWPTPAPINYGTALSATQLNATATVNGTPVAGTYAYNPASGAVLPAGNQTLSVTFIPTDTAHYTTASASVTLVVNKATPAVTWPTPSAITYGTALSGTQLNATASVPGSFVYSPAAGTVLSAGNQPLSVTFTPTDTTDYSAATAGVTLVVNKATPAVTWATPSAITYGTALSGTQLNATTSVPGSFAYSPAAGTVLSAGSQPLSVTFTPTDATDYTTATAGVTLTITQATPAFSGLTASQSIVSGTASISLAGTITAGSVYPTSGESVTITINGSAMAASIGSSGSFSTAFPTSTIPASSTPYAIAYSYQGDVNFASAANASTSLTVNQGGPSLVSISVTPSNSSIFLGGSQTFAATGTYSDSTTRDVTATATWSSSDTSAATMNANVATAASTGCGGPTTISATSGSVSGSTALKVTISGGSACFGHLLQARDPHTSTLLTTGPNSGMILVVGGLGTPNVPSSALNTAELFDPSSGSNSPVGLITMNSAHAWHTATLLNDGSVLIVGGLDNTGNDTTSAERYDPINNVFLPVGGLNFSRYQHTATLLPDGTVVIVGGWSTRNGIRTNAELYDPVTQAFSVQCCLNTPRYGHTATSLNDGSVVIAGGYASQGLTGSVELYQNGAFTQFGQLYDARAFHTATFVTPQNIVVFAGGWDAFQNFTPIEFFSSVEGPFTLGVAPYGGVYSLNQPRSGHTATLLPNGTIYIAGGAAPPALTPLSSSELIDLTTSAFAPTFIPNSPQTARFYHDATLLPDGSIFIDGGVAVDSTGANLIAVSQNELVTPAPQAPPTFMPLIAIRPSNSTISVGQGLNFRTFDVNENADGATWSGGGCPAFSTIFCISDTGVANYGDANLGQNGNEIYGIAPGSTIISTCGISTATGQQYCGYTTLTVQ